MTFSFPPPMQWPADLARIRYYCDRLIETAPSVTVAETRIRLRALRPFVEDPGGGMGKHSHSFYEMVLFLDGTSRLLPDETPLTSGVALVRHPQQLHAWEPLTRVVRLVLSFDLLPAKSLLSPLPSADAELIISDILRALVEVAGQRPGWEERVRCLAKLACSILLASGMPLYDQSVRMTGIPKNLATEIDEFLRDNMARPIRLADIAGHFGISERALTQHYARLTGDSIMARLISIRMEVANELLKSTEYSLAEIGHRVGVPDPSYFCRCFKKQFGHTPGHHRRI